MAKKPKQKHVSHKQQSRVAQEQRQRRILIISISVVAALVVLIIGYGILDNLVLQKIRPVAKVGDINISLEDFQTRVRYDRFQMIQSTYMLQQYQQIYQSFDASYAAYYDQLIQENLTKLNDPETLGNQVIDELINDAVISLKAEELGIAITEEEVDKMIQEAFGFYAEGTPTTAPTNPPVVTATYSAQLLTLIPPTATATLEPTPSEESTATTIPPTLEPTATVDPNATPEPTATPYPTSTPYTLEGFQQTFEDYAENLDLEAQFSKEEFREIFSARLLYEKVYEKVTADVSNIDTYIWARHILVATEEEALTVMEFINAGGDWSSLALQYSTDESNKTNGGDLGWFTSGQMVTEFNDAAFALTEIGQISPIVQTSFGYHIIQLLGREDREVTLDRLSELKDTKFEQWLQEARDGLEIETFENWKDNVPMIPVVPADFS